jgi:hypothetical protein
MAINEQVVQNVFDGAIADLQRRSSAAKYKTDITLWAKDVLGIHLWSKQREVAESVLVHKRTAVKSCHNAGKSKLAAIIACWWVATHPIGQAIVVTTAPTYQQVHGILWREISKHHQLAIDHGQPMPGYITQSDKWNINTPEGNFQAGWGRKPADTNLHGFQGVHERYVLVIVDEACGINESLWTAIEAITTTGDARILAIGNPDDPNTQFGKIFNDSKVSSQWSLNTISAFDTPNLARHFLNDPSSPHYKYAVLDKNFPDELRPFMLQEDTVDSWREQWSESDPRWKSKILGEFPDQSENSLFSQAVVNKAVETIVIPDHDSRPILGVDVARFGNDLSAIYSVEEGTVYAIDDDGAKTATQRRGKLVRRVKVWAKADGVEAANLIHQTALETGAREVRIDIGGLGAPIKDQVAVLAQTTYSVVGMNGNGPTPDSYHWKNARAWWHDSLREQMHTGTIDIDYGDDNLKNELLGIRYHFKNTHRALQVESKDDMAARNVKSPDHSDAVVYATAPLDQLLSSPLALYGIGEKFTLDANSFLTDGAGNKYILGAY